jgi:hypothetical protein
VKEGPQPVPQSTLNVAQCIDFWAREYQQGAHPMAQMQPVFATGTAPVPIHVSAQALAPAVVVPGAVLPFLATNTNPPDVQKKRKDGSGSDSGVRRKISAQIGSDGSAEKVDVSGRGKKKGRGKKTGKVDERVVCTWLISWDCESLIIWFWFLLQLRNRESAARSRAKRLEYTNELEQKVKTLKDTNKELRKKVIKAAKAPPDPYAGTLNGKQLRRTRTMPLWYPSTQ